MTTEFTALLTLTAALCAQGPPFQALEVPRARLSAAPSVTVCREVVAMGTTLGLRVEAADRPTALAASESALRAVERAETRLSTWRDDTELARFNAAPPGQSFVLSSELAADLALAVHWWRATDGAFDPGVGPLIVAFDLRHDGHWPAGEEFAAARAASGLRHLQLDGRRAVRRHPGLRIDEGAFGKGAALDLARAAARAKGATALQFNFGGQVLVDGREFHVGISHPRERSRAVAELDLDAGSASTSGNSEHGLVVDGRPLGHLLDPATGRPATDWGAVLVIAADAFAADCVSTGLFVQGPVAALAFGAKHPEFAVVTLVADGDRVHLRASPSLRGRLRALTTDVDLEFPTATPHLPSAPAPR
jgi:thiamine biosynthesis lipoprotein